VIDARVSHPADVLSLGWCPWHSPAAPAAPLATEGPYAASARLRIGAPRLIRAAGDSAARLPAEWDALAATARATPRRYGPLRGVADRGCAPGCVSMASAVRALGVWRNGIDHRVRSLRVDTSRGLPLARWRELADGLTPRVGQ